MKDQELGKEMWKVIFVDQRRRDKMKQPLGYNKSVAW